VDKMGLARGLTNFRRKITIRRPETSEASEILARQRDKAELIGFRTVLPKRKNAESIDLDRFANRMSEVLDVDVDRLLPAIEKEELTMPSVNTDVHSRYAEYDSIRHVVRYDPEFEEKYKEIRVFESLIYLLTPEKFKDPRNVFLELFGRNAKPTQFRSSLDALSKQTMGTEKLNKYYNNFIGKIRFLSMTVSGLLGMSQQKHEITIALLGIFGISSYKLIDLMVLRNKLGQIYNRHGQDGLLLYFIFPPEKMTGMQTGFWEREMVRLKLIAPTGGLTPRGVEFVRAVLPRDKLMDKLAQFEEYRERTKD
jgi:hypothetical protein